MASINPEVSSGDIRKIVSSHMEAVGEKYKFKVSIKRYAEFDAVVVDIFHVPRGHGIALKTDELKAKLREKAGCTVTISLTAPPGSDFAYVG